MKTHTVRLFGIVALLLASSLTGCKSNSNQLIIGLECNYAPFNWTENTSNEYTLDIYNNANKYADGYDIQIAKALGEKLNKEVIIMQTAWESLIPDLQFGTVDLIIAGMTDTIERRQSIDFSNEYYRSELVLVTKKDIADQYNKALTNDELSSLLNGKVCVSQKATVTNDVLDIFKTRYGSTVAPALDSFADCATDVKMGSAFLMTAELPVAKAIINANPTLGIIHIDQAILGEKQAELGVSIGIKKGNNELTNMVNEALASINQEKRNQMMIDAVTRSTSY